MGGFQSLSKEPPALWPSVADPKFWRAYAKSSTTRQLEYNMGAIRWIFNTPEAYCACVLASKRELVKRNV